MVWLETLTQYKVKYISPNKFLQEFRRGKYISYFNEDFSGRQPRQEIYKIL
jgi:hypothetical protein